MVLEITFILINNNIMGWDTVCIDELMFTL